MTLFCTQNIPTLFDVQFLSFPVNTEKKYFSQILITFLGPNTTRVGEVKNRAQTT